MFIRMKMLIIFVIKAERLVCKFPDRDFDKSANNQHCPISNINIDHHDEFEIDWDEV